MLDFPKLIETKKMYIDETIVAGVLVVLGTVGFFGGVAWFVWTDTKKNANKNS